MNTTAIRLIALREVKARWVLCPGALVFGILAMMVTRTLDPDDGGPATMLMIMRVVGFLAAGMIGLSLLGDQLTDGRLSFYFSRPFTPRAIFVGKLIGGVALAVAIDLCLVLPVVLGYREPEYVPDMPGFAVTMPEVMIGVAACVVLGMAAGIVVRSRTRWLVLDVIGVTSLLVMVSYVVLHAGTTARDIEDHTPFTPGNLVDYFSRLSVVLVLWLAAVLVSVAYATGKALARGRIDREIAHAALSKTLWPIVVPLGGLAVATVINWL